VMAKLDQFDYQGAAAISAGMLIVSFALLLAINALQAIGRRHAP
jgi:sulfate transport system permease protein